MLVFHYLFLKPLGFHELVQCQKHVQNLPVQHRGSLYWGFSIGTFGREESNHAALTCVSIAS